MDVQGRLFIGCGAWALGVAETGEANRRSPRGEFRCGCKGSEWRRGYARRHVSQASESRSGATAEPQSVKDELGIKYKI
ncbi:hypothetical protein M430DRAFT_230032 [Amorphotheca resinae ATCC 22711]|uniref:Uncharacterized protein n=1 Tax=Amorphotheca resinae ATCC 22711 TaxID=857342 RepID=A0A2T3B3D2_AMORE|nr:hypothetical protein M430DRAFT_230032 [Amorphotheca resinae ATCC 22711]PSS20156.1 hypothetical protein M430DRAFT_230032 [Amorphotheca resinae ATCC 22711]